MKAKLSRFKLHIELITKAKARLADNTTLHPIHGRRYGLASKIKLKISQISSATIFMAPHGHSVTHMAQPLQ